MLHFSVRKDSITDPYSNFGNESGCGWVYLPWVNWRGLREFKLKVSSCLILYFLRWAQFNKYLTMVLEVSSKKLSHLMPGSLHLILVATNVALP